MKPCMKCGAESGAGAYLAVRGELGALRSGDMCLACVESFPTKALAEQWAMAHLRDEVHA